MTRPAPKWTVGCEAHGDMQYREALSWWVCNGYDGEGCTAGPVTDEQIERMAAGEQWDGPPEIYAYRTGTRRLTRAEIEQHREQAQQP